MTIHSPASFTLVSTGSRCSKASAPEAGSPNRRHDGSFATEATIQAGAGRLGRSPFEILRGLHEAADDVVTSWAFVQRRMPLPSVECPTGGCLCRRPCPFHGIAPLSPVTRPDPWIRCRDSSSITKATSPSKSARLPGGCPCTSSAPRAIPAGTDSGVVNDTPAISHRAAASKLG
jgi:hypothetical protein